VSAQEINSQYLKAQDTFLELLEAPLSSVGPGPLGSIANAVWDTNSPNTSPPVQDMVSPSNPVVTSGHENSPLSATQLMPTLHSDSALVEISENRSSSTTATNPVHSRRQKNPPILPAPAKSYLGTSHASNVLAHLQQVYGPQEAQPKRSDRRELTEQEKENAREVREIGSCIMCTQKKQRVITFLDSSSDVLAD